VRVLLTTDPEIPVPPTLYGGIERIVDGLARELRARGYRVGLAAHPDSTAAVDAFFPWPGRASSRSLDTARNMAALWAAVRTFQPDVVHSFSRLWYLLPVLRSRLPKVMSYQRVPTRRTVAWAHWLAGPSLRFTGCSESICRLGRSGGGEWTAVPNFVDVDRFTFVPRVSEDAPLVFLSRVESIKGPDVAIEVARRAGRRLVIAGNHSGTPAEAAFWKAKVEPHLGRDGVQYVGPVNDRQKNELLGRAAALLVPIRWDEPFGIVFVEALACGTPVVTCPRGALPEIVAPGATGFLADKAEDLVAAVGRVSNLDRAACRQAAERQFSPVAIVGAYEGVYRSVTEGT
jgi:glycosyltransferase involved in cell wall biosynthesis